MKRLPLHTSSRFKDKNFESKSYRWQWSLRTHNCLCHGEENVSVLTSRQLVYMSLLSVQLSIESTLDARLVDHLNVEVVAGGVRTVGDGAVWLAETNLHFCVLFSPRLSGVEEAETTADVTLDARSRDLIHTAATHLHDAGLAVYDRHTGTIVPTELGRVASYYLLTGATVAKATAGLAQSTDETDLLRLFSNAVEFAAVSFRETERSDVGEKADDPACKINILTQAYIGRVALDCFAPQAETTYVAQSASRLLRAYFELLLRGWAQPALAALTLAKAAGRLLFSSQCPLRQVGAPADICRRLERVDVPFDRLFDLTPTQLGELIRAPAQGQRLHTALRSFPPVAVAAESKQLSRSTLSVKTIVAADFSHDAALG